MRRGESPDGLYLHELVTARLQNSWQYLPALGLQEGGGTAVCTSAGGIL